MMPCISVYSSTNLFIQSFKKLLCIAHFPHVFWQILCFLYYSCRFKIGKAISYAFSKDLSHYLPRCLYTRTYCPVLILYASFGRLPGDSFPLLYTCGISLSASHRYCALSDLYTLWYYSCSIRTGSVRLHNRYLPV